MFQMPDQSVLMIKQHYSKMGKFYSSILFSVEDVNPGIISCSTYYN